MPLHSILLKTLLRTYYYFHLAVVKSEPLRGQPLCQGHRAGTGGRTTQDLPAGSQALSGLGARPATVSTGEST